MTRAERSICSARSARSPYASTPDAAVGDYVLVHAGFAIQIIDAQEAAETLSIVEDLADLVDEELPA